MEIVSVETRFLQGRDIHTLDAATGNAPNRFEPPGFFGVWGINQPVIIGKLIQPVGPKLYTLDAATGSEIHQYTIGGSMTYNRPTVVGKTLYIGNSWGWVTALPLSTVIGGAID